jgi:hypothetical protein
LAENRQAVVEILREEQGLAPEPAAAVAPPAPAPWAQVEPAPTEPAPVRGVAQPAPKPEQPKVVPLAGASVWGASKGDIIRERLGRIPAGARVAIYGDVEVRSKRGLPQGVAAIARVALLGRDVDLVTADGLEEALGRVGYLIVFHSALERSVGTAAVVEMARTRGILVEVISGTVAQEAAQ